MNILLNLLFPKRCIGCGRFGKYFCGVCSPMVKSIGLNEAICPVCARPAFDGRTHPRCRGRYTIDGLSSLVRYDGVVRSAIKSIKYRYTFDMVNDFVDTLPLTSHILGPLLRHINESQNGLIFVPIPLHPFRRRQRGFNQAEIIGAKIAVGLNTPMEKNVLARARFNQPQVSMKSRSERLHNMNHIFTVRESAKSNLSRSVVVLFDDVFTTGATLRSAANTLKRAGASFVWGLTVAR